MLNLSITLVKLATIYKGAHLAITTLPPQSGATVHTIQQLGKDEALLPGTSQDLRGCQCGTADMANLKSSSPDRITGITN